MSDRPAWADEIIREVAGLRGEVAGLRGEVAGLRAWAEAEFSAVRAELADLRGEVARARAEVDALRARFDAEIPRLRADLMARVDRLQDLLTGVRNDIGVNFASSDRAIRLVRSHREEIVGIEEQVSALTRVVHSLQGQIDALRGAA